VKRVFSIEFEPKTFISHSRATPEYFQEAEDRATNLFAMESF
jgi:hypothetical protein